MATLKDLATFGIHVNNPTGKCCICQGPTNGVTLDDLCAGCNPNQDRWVTEFYTTESIWVVAPIYYSGVRVSWDNWGLVLRDQMSYVGIVKIDRSLYVVRYFTPSNSALYYWRNSQHRVRGDALRIDQAHLERLYEQQVAATTD